MKLLSLKNISYKYNSFPENNNLIIKNISFDIKKCEFIGIVGSIGSGKSTLIQHMNGLLKPITGSILFHGADIWSKNFCRKELRQKVAVSFQHPDYQFFENTVLKEVMFGPKNQGLTYEQQYASAKKALELTGISYELFNASPFSISGGEKRRVSIACALAMNPEVLILDEPAAGLDPKGKYDILNYIKNMQYELQLTVVLVSHNMDDVAEYVDRLLVINDGEVLFDDIPSNVFRNVEKLESIGLNVPETIYILNKLKSIGFNIDEKKIKINDMVKEIISNLQLQGDNKI